MMNKNLITNIIAIIVLFLGYIIANNHIFYIGLFAFSGAITNSLAIYMLFEKVPFLYGSGVIEDRFEDFKASIKNLMLTQFFSPEKVDNFFNNEIDNLSQLSTVIEKVDFSLAFDSLKESVEQSAFGGMLNMFGGVSALDPLKEPFIEKLKSSIISITQSKSFQTILKDSFNSDDIRNKIEILIQQRLDELTPKIVKEIVEDFIKEHLGWLVVWGGVVGAIIGLISSFIGL